MIRKDIIRLDPADVTVKPVEIPTCECGAFVTSAIWMDLRNNGLSVQVMEGCRRCTKAHVERLRKSLEAE